MLYIGVDLGTSAVKLLLMDESGKVLNIVSKEYPISFPKPGWSEQNPCDWWEQTVAGLIELTKDFDRSAVAGISFGGQMHGLVVLDENDNVIRPAILWNDGRTQKETDYLNNVIGKEKLSELTGNIAFAGFTAPKILWLKANEPENFARIKKLMLPKDYIAYRMTGVFSTDYSDASGMLLLDVKNKCWSKENLVVIFGGRSSEHEVSCISVQTVAKAVDTEKYNMTLVGITKEGKWLRADNIESIADGSWRDGKVTAVISPDTTKELLILNGDKVERQRVDVIFPVLHGMYGEDGTIQGLFEMADIPYVGCGVLASAASMDKFYTKIIVDNVGVRQAKFVPVLAEDFGDLDAAMDRVETGLDYPVFVKPSKAGSSKGVNKAVDRQSLKSALEEAVKFDNKILVEETIVGRELECGVLGYKDNTQASGVGEILAAAEFYDFDAKYNNAESKTVIGADIPAEIEAEIREDAVKIFRALDGFGLSRVDFFLEKGTNKVVFNEINTLPGFTGISMYPMLWNAKGYDIGKLVTTLIEMAKER